MNERRHANPGTHAHLGEHPGHASGLPVDTRVEELLRLYPASHNLWLVYAGWCKEKGRTAEFYRACLVLQKLYPNSDIVTKLVEQALLR